MEKYLRSRILSGPGSLSKFWLLKVWENFNLSTRVHFYCIQ